MTSLPHLYAFELKLRSMLGDLEQIIKTEELREKHPEKMEALRKEKADD